jgi:hypothetical protein
MVPGMTERETLAADVQRVEWLADAALGPTQMARPPGPPAVPSGSRYFVPLGLCRRNAALVHSLGRRIHAIRLRSAWSGAKDATGQPIAQQRPTI